MKVRDNKLLHSLDEALEEVRKLVEVNRGKQK